MDFGMLVGMLMTLLLVAWALFSAGNLNYYWDYPSFILVVGGTVGVTIMSFPAKHLKQTTKVLMKAFFYKPKSIEKLIQDMVSYAEVARRDGILSLENVTKEIDDPFIVGGIQMAVDGTDPELIQQIMETELENAMDRHSYGKSIIDDLGKYAPALGMIGTLIGLVVMLQNLDDPSKIGPGMAIALLTTMYGAMISYICTQPLAARMNRRSSEEILYKTVIIKGVMAIQSGDNPRIVEQKLRTFLAPALRQANAREGGRDGGRAEKKKEAA